jgi:pyruvate-ferredoxin/flavodoxin oxidoreductase
MSGSQAEMKKAVDTGYWTLYRYDPRNEKAPLTIDSPKPTKDYQEFLDGENRYVSLKKKSPEHAQLLFAASAKEAAQRRESLERMVAEQTK